MLICQVWIHTWYHFLFFKNQPHHHQSPPITSITSITTTYSYVNKGSKLVLEHGSVWLSKKTVTTGWTLDKGKGDRTYEHEVTFSTTFSTPPKVFAAFSALGISSHTSINSLCSIWIPIVLLLFLLIVNRYHEWWWLEDYMSGEHGYHHGIQIWGQHMGSHACLEVQWNKRGGEGEGGEGWLVK